MSVSVIIPAYQAAYTVADTVRAARSIPGVSEIIVVDDASRDATAEAAREGGADQVIVLRRNTGKGGALTAGVRAAHHQQMLFLDADLGHSAVHAARLLDAAPEQHSMAVAVFPKGPGGGLGLTRSLASATIRLLAGIRVAAPLSGQRALPAEVVRHIGLAPRFGVETALAVEASHLGIPIVEVPLPLEHDHTGRTVSGFYHRAKQFRDILRYGLPLGFGLGWPALSGRQTAVRICIWLLALACLTVFGGEIAPPNVGDLLAAVGAVGVLTWIPSLWVGAVWLRLRKPNHLGRSLPAAAGLLFPVVAVPAVWLSGLPHDVRVSAAIVIGVLGAVGLADDIFAGRRQARGLRGHLISLVRGRVTTGSIKALGGLAAGLVAGAILEPGRPAIAFVDGLLIALTANFINLLDLRPSRALKGFALLSAIAVFASPALLLLVGPLLVLAVVAAPAEFAGRVMIGDVGANVLGGAVGLALAASLAPWQTAAAVVLLLAIHILAERVSLSDIISRSRVLRSLDLLGTAHLPPLPSGKATSA